MLFNHSRTFPSLALSANFGLTRQDGRTMLDYAIIGKKDERNPLGSKHDELIAFLQTCSCLPEFIVLILP